MSLLLRTVQFRAHGEKRILECLCRIDKTFSIVANILLRRQLQAYYRDGIRFLFTAFGLRREKIIENLLKVPSDALIIDSSIERTYGFCIVPTTLVPIGGGHENFVRNWDNKHPAIEDC
jgi:hypothetical protein